MIINRKNNAEKNKTPPIVKIEVKNELKNIENFIAKIFKAPPYILLWVEISDKIR